MGPLGADRYSVKGSTNCKHENFRKKKPTIGYIRPTVPLRGRISL